MKSVRSSHLSPLGNYWMGVAEEPDHSAVDSATTKIPLNGSHLPPVAKSAGRRQQKGKHGETRALRVASPNKRLEVRARLLRSESRLRCGTFRFPALVQRVVDHVEKLTKARELGPSRSGRLKACYRQIVESTLVISFA
jgi:hypothetical protein